MKTIGVDISVLNDEQKTGIGVYTYQLIDALLKINKEDKFILFGIATFSTYDFLKNLAFKNYPNVQMRIFKLPARSFRLAFLTWQKLNWPPIEKFIGPIDIFHSFNWLMPPQKKGKRVATIFDLTSILYPQWHDPRTVQLDRLRFKGVGQDADLVITISQNTKNDFLKFYPQARVEVIYPGADKIFNSRVDQKFTKKVLEKYQLKPGFLLSVATLEPRKNLKGLIEAYSESGIKTPLVLAGKMGWKNSEQMKLIEGNHQIKITGFLPEDVLKVFYQQALCLVYPSFYEGFGIPVLEALSSGTPVITSRNSSLIEVGEKAVFYVDPYDKESIKEALILISSGKNLRASLSQKGFVQARKFSWEVSARQLNDLYRSL